MIMKRSFRIGFSFGLTSGIITTLGLMVGLYAGTHSQLAVIGGILTIAIADAMSDSLGMHVSVESLKRKKKEIWESMLYTLVSKFMFAIAFIIPVLLLPLATAVMVSIAFGLLVLGVFSYIVGKRGKASPWKAVAEHLLIAAAVIVATYYVGAWVGSVFV